MESDGEELDYDFDTPQKTRVSESRLTAASADKNQVKPREGEGAAANANADTADVKGKRAKKSKNDDQEDVEEELYGDIVSPDGAGAGRGGGAALLTLQVAEVRTIERGRGGGERGVVRSNARSRKFFEPRLKTLTLFQPKNNDDSSSAAS